MNFGQALQLIRQGKRVARRGWNGKNMWICLYHPGHMHLGYMLEPCIAIKTAQNVMQPGWLASQNDMLAEDWEEIH